MTKKPLTQKDIAAAAGISTRTLRTWRGEGTDITDLKAVMKRAATAHHRAATSEDMGAAKLRKLIADANRSETLDRKEAGLLVEAEGIHRQGEQIGRAVSAELTRLQGDLPGMLGGRKATEIFAILKREFRRMQTNLSQFKNHETAD